MRILKLIPPAADQIIVSILMSFLVLANASADGNFDQGLKAYQEKKFEDAKSSFEKALTSQPNEPSILYNLGLAELELGKRGAAIGHWRKALAISPGLRAPLTALEQTQEKFHFNQLEKSATAQSIHSIFANFGWDLWLGLFAFFLGSTGWLWLSYFKKRKAVLATDHLEMPSASVGLIALTVFFFLAALGLAGKAMDEQKVRATAIQSVELKSAPSADGVTLSTVSEGSELQILRDHDGWYQVSSGEGAGGWVKKTDVIEATSR